jgi:predicted helicase
MTNGYIYIRKHSSYDKYNVCKLGKTINLINRNSTYKTGEVECGFFELVIQVSKIKLDIIERLLQNKFKSYHYYLNGGTEFFKKDIIILIVPYLETLNLEFKVLSVEQIKLIIYQNNIKIIFNKINIEKFKNILKYSIKNKKTNNIIIPQEHQLNVLLKIKEFYNNNNIGKIIHACGLGKALLGILIAHQLKCKLVVIGVPSIYLQKQMKNEILKIFDNYNNILYVGGEAEDKINSTTNIDEINKFINNKNIDCKFIITTYSSCHLLSNNSFDLKIGDEAHHLVGSDNEITKLSFHKIKAKKTLFMTATEKIIENKNIYSMDKNIYSMDKNIYSMDKNIYSMDDIIIFGESIDFKSINWAIENKKITDYNILILKNTENEINNIINSLDLNKNEEYRNSIVDHKDLFLAAFMGLKSIEKYDDLTHVLIYTNKTENSELIKKYIDIILDLNILNINKNDIYNKALHSNNKENIIENEINKFKKASCGIISSVYIFSEGFDCPKLNGVIFAENMESEIRIVQSTLRPNRLDKMYPNKKAYIIIPYIDTENFITNNESFDKCRKIIAKIRNEDENIIYKINLVSFNKINNQYTHNNLLNVHDKIKYYHIIENKEELNKIILRLRYSKALFNITYTEEQDEYNFIKQLNKELNINNKEDYTKEFVKTYHEKYIEYIKNPEEYFKLKGVWTNWYDFMGIDTSKFIQDKNDWIKFCKENNVKSLMDYNNLCKLNEILLPSNPADFYKEFVSISIELELNTKRRK